MRGTRRRHDLGGWASSLLALALVGVVGSGCDAPVRPNAAPLDTPEQVEARLHAVLGSPPFSTDRVQGLAALLADASGANIEMLCVAYAEAYGRFGAGYTYETRVLMSRWAEIDPLAALETALTFEGDQLRRNATTEVARRWAIDDPIAALDFVQDIRDQERLQTRLWQTVAEGWSQRNDAEDATPMIAALPAEWGRERTTRRFAGALLAAGGTDRLTDWAESVPHDAPAAFRRVAFRKTALVLFHDVSPAAAKAWLETHDNDPDAQASLLVIASEATARRPLETLDWLLSRPPSSGRFTALGKAFGQWAKSDFETAFEWLDAQYAEDPKGLDAAASTAVLTLAAHDRERAFAFAERIPEGASQDAALTVIAQHWYAEEPDAALLWIARSKLPRALKTQARVPLNPRLSDDANAATASKGEP